MTPDVSVLGLGNWGTALANHLAERGCSVVGWSIVPEVVEGINSKKRNPLALSEFELKFKATGNLVQCLNAKYLVLVIPSGALGKVVPELTISSDSVLVSAIKGFEEKSTKTPLSYIASVHPKLEKLAVLSGPSFARDVISKRPCGIVSASKNIDVAKNVAELFSSTTMKVYTSKDPIGVELGGAVKNVIALAAGVSDGLGFGDSARAGVITRGLAEMMRLAEACGGERATLAGLSGLGDLAMTATSDLSRNRTVGKRLGAGESLEAILKSLGSVAEGVYTAPIVISIAKEKKVEMPITEQVGRLLKGEITARQMAEILMSRPQREEF